MTAAEAVTPTAGAVLRRARFWIVVAILVVALAVGTALANSTQHLGTTFDPDNPGPEGALALRSVLEQQGVAVTKTTTVAEAAGAAGTLLVDGTDATIPADAWRRLLAGRTRVVVVAPDSGALAAVLPGTRQLGDPGAGTPSAGCALSAAQRAGSMSLTGVTTSLGSSSATVCFATGGGRGQLVSGEHDGAQVVLLASRTPFTDEHIGAAGDAAVALNVLGATDRLVWFQQSALDPAAAGGRSLQDLTPPWVTPVAALLLLGGLATALWRGRRLGPIVVEALPVVVRSRETVEGRARLYDRGRARLRAADALRMGAIGRLAPVLGLPSTASVDEVIAAAARLTGADRGRLGALLLTEEPSGDADLVRISDGLAALEAAVRAAVVRGIPSPAPTNGAR